jgi:hypothetical protein
MILKSSQRPGFQRGLSRTLFAFAVGTRAYAADPVAYALMPDSLTFDECQLCGRPTIPEATTGGFQLRLIDNTFPNSIYAVEQLTFDTVVGGVPRRHGTGGGTLVLGGDFVLTVSLELDLQVDDGTGPKAAHLKSSTVLAKGLPDYTFSLLQTDGTIVHTLHAEWVAEPVETIPWHWVSVSATAGVVAWPASYGTATVQRRAVIGGVAVWETVDTVVTLGSKESTGRFPLSGSGGFYRLRWSSR